MASFVDAVKKFAELNKPKMPWSGGDFGAWQKGFKEKVWALKGRDIARAALRAELSEKQDCGTYTLQKVTVGATEISDASGYLLVPKYLKGKSPAIIASPGHYQFGKDTIAGTAVAEEELQAKPESDYGREAVEAGYVTFVPDWWGWGDKSGHLDLVGPNRDQCNTIQNAASMYGFSVLYLNILEAEAVTDFLAGLECVDSERIGIIGNSYGGRIAMWIGAYNEKIKVVVAGGSMNLFSERAEKLSSCAIQYFPGLLEFGDVDDLFCLIAPKPLQLQAGTEDPLIAASDRDAMAVKVISGYKSAGAADKLSIEIMDTDHRLRFSVARTFLENYL